MQQLEYVVTLAEIRQPSKWSVKVLGSDFDRRHDLPRKFSIDAKEYIDQASNRTIDIEEFNRLLRVLVLEYEVNYPDLFTQKQDRSGLGWYEMQTLAKYCTEGRVTIEGWSLAKALEDREALKLQAKERLKVAQTLKVLEQEQKDIFARELLAKLEEERLPVTVGMEFYSKRAVLDAYKELIESRLEGKAHIYQKNREDMLPQLVTVQRVKGKWIVLEVLVEGGRAWREGLR